MTQKMRRKYMDQYIIEHFKRRLMEEKKKLLNTMNKMKNSVEFGSMDEYYTELSAYDNHPADIGTEMFMMEHDKGLRDKLNDTLYEIDTSLEAIKRGEYGVCIHCGKEIDEERLELIPYVKLCLECSKNKIDLEDKMNFRPEEEDSISPFSNYEDGKDLNAFDSEDSYQEVARYNKVSNDPSNGTGDFLGVFDEDNSGYVEDVEKISKEYYEETLK